MDLWRAVKIQEIYNRPFMENVISNNQIFDPRKSYKLIVFYGKAGSFKSSTINMMMGVDLLESGVNDDGISKGVTLCKNDTILIADTEGIDTDNSSVERYDIIALFCVCHTFILTSLILNRFNKKEITELIEEKLHVLDKIFNINQNDRNKPSLIILCPVVNRIKAEKIKCFRDKAESFKNDLIKKQYIKNFFSDIEIIILSPLTQNVLDIILDSDKFKVADIDQNNIQEVQQIYTLIMNNSKAGMLGSCFKNLNTFYEFAKQNTIVDPIIYDNSIQFIRNMIETLSIRWSTFEGDYNLYKNQVQINYNESIKIISALGHNQQIIEKYYKESFIREYENFKKSKGDNFNDKVYLLINSIYDNEKINIMKGIKSNQTMTYQDLQNKINQIKTLLNSIKYVNDAIDQSKIFKIKDLIKSKSMSLDKDFEGPYVEFQIIKSEQIRFFNERIELIDVPITLKDEKVEELKFLLKSNLLKAIQNFYNKNRLKLIDRKNLVEQCLENFKFECLRHYELNFKLHHEICIKMIETERISIFNMINTIDASTTFYNMKIVDDFSNAARASDSRFFSFTKQKYYDFYWSDFYTQVFINNYDLVCDKSVKSCVYSTAYHQCPDCGNIWEQRMDQNLDRWVGCGNYACLGRTIGCGGRSFRTNIKEGNKSNKLAKQLNYTDVERLCKSELDNIKITAKSHLTSSLRKNK